MQTHESVIRNTKNVLNSLTEQISFNLHKVNKSTHFTGHIITCPQIKWSILFYYPCRNVSGPVNAALTKRIAASGNEIGAFC